MKQNPDFPGSGIPVFLLMSLLVLAISCKKPDDSKNNPKTLASVSTSPVTNIGEYSAVGGGNVTKTGNDNVTARGVCWSTSPEPNLMDPHTTDGTGSGVFSSNLINLIPGTPYYVRAYATNNQGTAYGAQVQFTSEGNNTLPQLSTSQPANVTVNTADLGGHISSAGTSPVTDRGICWALFANPTIQDNKISCGSDTGSFTATITSLASNTPYFTRAYATNLSGTAYGNEIQFTTGGGTGTSCPGMATFVDTRDGQVYPTVQIGSQCWMKKNLNIGSVIEIHVDQDPTTYQKWCYGNVSGNCDIYGGLYQWDEIMQGSTQIGIQGICPDGWHIPTDGEFATLTYYLGGYDQSGEKMKEAGFIHWDPPNTGANDSSGFSALPGGYRYSAADSLTYGIRQYGYFWTSSGTQGNVVWVRLFSFNTGVQERTALFHLDGGSLRCIKNQ
ncbi:MAG: hypothetical protein HXX13_09015 [Bacteroidetes bacterium]|nr:hypothetical protein [Bacteroidota bacterium]